MSTAPKVLAFAGSTRTASYNKRLVHIAAAAARSAGAEVTVIDLRDFPLPIFDEDVEHAGTPENATKLKQMFVAHQGLILSCPEYNSSITAVLKNTLDWVSRPTPGEASLIGFTNKAAAIMSASPGALGGLRGLVHVRSILSNIGVLVLPDQMAISKAFEAFADDGSLKDAKQQATVERIAGKLVTLLKKLHAQ